MKLKSKIFILLLLFSATVLGCARVNIDTYTGDGTIEKTGSWPISYGYLITFDKIKLNEDYHREFNVENFPHIGKSYSFQIKINIEEKLLDVLKSGEGQLHMKVFSEEGTIFFDINEKISKWRFSETYIDETMVKSDIFYFDSKKMSSIDEEKLKDTNKIKFSAQLSGAETNPPIVGKIQLRVGGFY